jgi:signal peptidase I
LVFGTGSVLHVTLRERKTCPQCHPANVILWCVQIDKALGFLVLVLAVAGCGGRDATKGGVGSIPVATVTVPHHTETLGIPSASMEPTMHCAVPASGCLGQAPDGVVVDEPASNLRRADVIAFHVPQLAVERCGAGGVFIKRIVGLPGETFEERQGYVYIDGEKIDEPYIKPDRRDFTTHQPLRIDPGNYFVMGDNRASSCDSRVWGTVPTTSVIGKVVKVLRVG